MQNPGHADHARELSRIKRIRGQLEGVQKMIEERRYCPDILSQTRAISSAIRSLEVALLENHLNHCVAKAFDTKDELEREDKIRELLELFAKRLPK